MTKKLLLGKAQLFIILLFHLFQKKIVCYKCTLQNAVLENCNFAKLSKPGVRNFPYSCLSNLSSLY